MKILIVAGMQPFDNPAGKDVLGRKLSVGGDPGNLFFINGVERSLMVSDDVEFIPTNYRANFSDSEIDYINSECSYFVLPMADILKDDTIGYLQGLTHLILKLKIPCIVLGIGLRAPYEPEIDKPRKCDETVRKFISAVLEKSAQVGVRGEVTAQYLAKLGFKIGSDVEVIGCPSVCAFDWEEITQSTKPTDNLSVKNETIITNTLAPKQVSRYIVKSTELFHSFDVTVQKDFEQEDVVLGRFSGIYKGRIGLPENVFGNKLYREIYSRDGFNFFTNIHSWVSYAKEKTDFCFSTRFHGAVASILAGKPTVVIPIDSRMRELVEYHNIPHMTMDKLDDGHMLEQLQTVNYTSHLSTRDENRRRYVSCLKKNGLPNIFEKEYQGEVPYDIASKKIEWRGPEHNFSHVSFGEKLSRVSSYYGGKIFARFHKKGL